MWILTFIHTYIHTHTHTGDDNDDVDVDGRLKTGALVFNSTTEFSNRLQARLNEKVQCSHTYIHAYMHT